MVLLGAIAEARHSVRIVTPYFLPDVTLMEAIRVAILRGVQVELVLPARGNLRLVDWAMAAQLPRLVAWGCHVYRSPPPFDHTKLVVVDGEWSLVGSANWDARSLRLNFEYNVECYSVRFAEQLSAIIDGRIAISRAVTTEELKQRSTLLRVRDGIALMAQPYL